MGRVCTAGDICVLDVVEGPFAKVITRYYIESDVQNAFGQRFTSLPLRYDITSVRLTISQINPNRKGNTRNFACDSKLKVSFNVNQRNHELEIQTNGAVQCTQTWSLARAIRVEHDRIQYQMLTMETESWTRVTNLDP